MRAYKAIVALIALGMLFGIYFTVKEITPKSEEDGVTQRVMECYQAALDCKEDLSYCSSCYEYCQDKEGKNIVNNSLDYCVKGEAQEIIDTAKNSSS